MHQFEVTTFVCCAKYWIYEKNNYHLILFPALLANQSNIKLGNKDAIK